MKKILAMTLSIIMTCAALTACGDTAQPSEESKAETTTTTAAETTTTETTTETPAETEETTTTTTATETETTTTTEAAEESETATETEAPSENPEETGIVTMEDNPEGMYPVEECFRRKAEELTGKKAMKFIKYDSSGMPYALEFEDGETALLAVYIGYVYEPSEKISLDRFVESNYFDVEGSEVVVQLTE